MTETEEWCVGYRVEFVDGSPPLSCILGFGPRDLCERALDRMPVTVAPYWGRRTASAAVLFACATWEVTRA